MKLIRMPLLLLGLAMAATTLAADRRVEGQLEMEGIPQVSDQTRERHDKMKKTVSDLQESLDYLRLSIKYLVFDLEATRRENKYLREMINKQDANGGPSLDDDQDDNQPF